MVIRPPGEGLALRTRRTAASVAALALGAAGCTGAQWSSSADREVDEILTGKKDRVRLERERGLVLPRPAQGDVAGGFGEPREP
ncbi:MAG TPA: hypothetical protein VFS92_03700, partial [Planctomycetota bacterium]|nr:hypothetical protein [Planctomycetota bacterium]